MAQFVRAFMTVLAAGAIAFGSSGCKTTKTTEVKDKLFGGTEVKETTVTELGGKATVTEKKTEYNANGEKVKMINDVGEMIIQAKVTPACRPGQVIVYNGWEPYMFRGWRGPMDLEPGLVKWLHLAGGYGHLRYWPLQWQPTPVDRAVRVNIERSDGAGPERKGAGI